MKLNTTSFRPNSEIPSNYTCEGADVSPELSWDEVPTEAKSLVLIVDDPDAPDPAAPKMTWVHWILYNIPPIVHNLEQGIADQELPSGTLQGVNDWRRIGYSGPCPPVGRHRYYYKLYALDDVLPDLGKPAKADLENAMQGHIIAYAELVGTYKKH